ncbi:ectonucleotide pyrophosphatase/phosphodiesterase [Pseudoalteromonas sp. SSM20]|uniref:alkaline phosphatase family protein n=1 Tax=Pseudoalteromonas sp. SSM20 TaxID=3139394 RepID=UPI003BA87AF6
MKKIVAFFLVMFSALSMPTFAKEQTVILISLDGFRWDYIEKHQAKNLAKIAKAGVRAERMIPVYPTKTFPNHISIITGLQPANHGIIDNKFCDKKRDECYSMGKGGKDSTWLNGMPLWNLAEMQGVKAATYFWPESDARFNGRTPSYFYHYSQHSDYQRRIDQIVEWLSLPKSQRPRFIASYFSIVDSMGHEYGPNAKQTFDAVQQMDALIAQLDKRLAEFKELNINLVLVSDHGMSQVDPKQTIEINQLGISENDFVIKNSYTRVQFYKKPESQVAISDIEKHLAKQAKGRYTVLDKAILAERGIKFGSRDADIIIETVAPKTFAFEGESEYLGTHGYAYTQEMGALFIAKGPAFKQNKTLGEIPNLDVYPTIAKVMGLKLLSPVDSDGKSLAQALKKSVN